MGNSDQIDYFSLCLMDDDKNFRKSHSEKTEGYRVILHTSISTILLLDDKDYDFDNVLRFVRMRYSADDLLRATIVFLPVINDQHWTVYCINKVHNQIEILDPQDWPNENDRNEHHLKMAPKFRERLSFAFQMFAGTSFPDFSKWTITFSKVPLQNPKHDCAFFSMLYIEFYDGANRDIVTEKAIDKDQGHVYRAQYLYYLLFHRLNQAPRPFPEFVEKFAPGAH